jgi:hypothetical protein
MVATAPWTSPWFAMGTCPWPPEVAQWLRSSKLRDMKCMTCLKCAKYPYMIVLQATRFGYFIGWFYQDIPATSIELEQGVFAKVFFSCSADSCNDISIYIYTLYLLLYIIIYIYTSMASWFTDDHRWSQNGRVDIPCSSLDDGTRTASLCASSPSGQRNEGSGWILDEYKDE